MIAVYVTTGHDAFTATIPAQAPPSAPPCDRCIAVAALDVDGRPLCEACIVALLALADLLERA